MNFAIFVTVAVAVGFASGMLPAPVVFAYGVVLLPCVAMAIVRPIAQPKITIRRDVQYARRPRPGSEVHFKGFATRIDSTDPHNVAMAKQLMQRLKAIQPNRIVWDGDNYSMDSFTRLIPEIHRELGGAVELVAFVRECDQERFVQRRRHRQV